MKFLQKVHKELLENSRPLTAMLKNSGETDCYNPSGDRNEAFNILKKAMTSLPVLDLPKRKLPFMIDTEALEYEMDTTLLQKQDQNDLKSCKIVGF